MARPKLPRKLRKREGDGARAVVDEVIVLYHRLAWVAERIHETEGRSSSRRGVLRGLARYGPATVPELSRARSVRRQSIQPVVNGLLSDGLVELVDNPAHARSRIVRITSAGRAVAAKMDRADERVMAAVGEGIAARELAVTRRTLARLRERFEAELRWRASLEGE